MQYKSVRVIFAKHNTMTPPKKEIPRSTEITAAFIKLMEEYLAELRAGKVKRRFHTSDFAEKLFIHPRHLTNTLKQETGQSPCDMLEERITRDIITLLEQTDMPIAAIASRFAFDEPTNFTKFFKGMTGSTPLQYRKKFIANK